MSKFDDTVNAILYKQLLEQVAPSDQSSEDINVDEEFKKIQTAKQDIYNVIKQNEEQYKNEVTQKFNEIDQLANKVITDIMDIDKKYLETLEEATFQEIWGSTVEELKKAGKWTKDKFNQGQDWLADKIINNISPVMDDIVGTDTTKYVNDTLSENIIYKIIAILEPTGVMSWPYLKDAADLYERNQGGEKEDIYALNLLAATIAVIPGVKAVSIFALPFKILTWGTGLSRLTRGLFGAKQAERVASSMSSKILEALGKNPNSAKVQKLLSSGRLPGRVTNLLRNIFTKGSRIIASGAKAATIMSSGDVPKMVDDWITKGKGLMNQRMTSSPLGQFSSFPEYRTN